MEGEGLVVVLPSTLLKTRHMQAVLMHLGDVARMVLQTLTAVQGLYSSTIQVVTTTSWQT